MARLRFKSQVPPRGWFYIEQATKLRIVGESLGDLTSKVVAHRKYRNLVRATTEEASLDIERQVCARLGKRDCSAEGIEDEWTPVDDNPVLRLADVMGFSKAAFEWIKGGQELVPASEADRRAEICKGCPLNAAMTGCKCSIFYKTVALAIPFERRDPALGVCGICRCSLQAKVNLPASVIKASDSGHKFPAHCWIPATTQE